LNQSFQYVSHISLNLFSPKNIYGVLFPFAALLAADVKTLFDRELSKLQLCGNM
jgi:hypothetical protein